MQIRIIQASRSDAERAKQVNALRAAIGEADAVVVGAGAGFSTAAGFVYSGERFERWLGDFGRAYGFSDMYSGGFYPFPTPEERWAYWSRFIWCNRYEDAPKDTYGKQIGRASCRERV